VVAVQLLAVNAIQAVSPVFANQHPLGLTVTMALIAQSMIIVTAMVHVLPMRQVPAHLTHAAYQTHFATKMAHLSASMKIQTKTTVVPAATSVLRVRLV
jgi:hypothetical protein